MLKLLTLYAGVASAVSVWPLSHMLSGENAMEIPPLEIQEDLLPRMLLQVAGLQAIQMQEQVPEQAGDLPYIQPLVAPQGATPGSVVILRNFDALGEKMMGKTVYSVAKRHPSKPVNDLQEITGVFSQPLRGEAAEAAILTLANKPPPAIMCLDAEGLTEESYRKLRTLPYDAMLVAVRKDELVPNIGEALVSEYIRVKKNPGAARGNVEKREQEPVQEKQEPVQEKQEPVQEKQEPVQEKQEPVQEKAQEPVQEPVQEKKDEQPEQEAKKEETPEAPKRTPLKPMDPKLLPNSFDSSDDCMDLTNKCSGHGSCQRVGEKWQCVCKSIKAGSRTTSWAGKACQKVDVSWQFNLILWSVLALIFAIGAGISMLTSIGNEPLPGILRTVGTAEK